MSFHTHLRLACLAASALLVSCTATEQTAENAAPRSIPTEVNSDADRRAIYQSNGTISRAGVPVPDATPNVMRLGEDASDINRTKRPETLNTNDPNLTTPETRLRRIDQSIADTLRRP
ncbi:hypothetical protein [Hymenobacter bucti]|uniref:Lipoprotein n=1 Tax=Hymenobacter bucti TaxID=1844114 RepID=A0ABW4QQ68_9BACT